MNEHLMEALRRLRQSSTDTNVDRRLVNNILLSYLSTPRGDTKRFEMLSLLATILSWNDDERERAGLQRKGGPVPAPMSAVAGFFGRGSPTRARNLELEKTDETEVCVVFRSPICSANLQRKSFSRLWVEFLLTEAAAGEEGLPAASSPMRSPRNQSLPSSPTRSTPRQPSLLSPPELRGTKRLPSFTSAAMSSSPNLVLQPPPEGKGKERADF